ncbi:MAG: hypothetical protein A2W98_00880 [Bacteroidetes bacterium GWF2_33_38]|nr:MAG: hypothetical protein A2W98_00880 [Bacteroidetes bacterium GWF2_33_38]OFY73611.1 MAG: hypothetical protein A2265_03910 [Bacteroidetes bacterium RIFOXYA12_FULL_33_9]OFY92353.1 MAG: hypothetical protein A2236_00870 [Bacteroidetes bacterium RIFOXYA2_FULL_33_7]HBX50652.1 hypothetical protein [Bacteroidales bacterium]
MQLKHFMLAVLVLVFTNLKAQDDKVLNEKEVNFLFNYYQQDGDHSPVTGGKGTEKLECIAPLITVNIPVDTLNSFGMTVGVDYYSSASCDNIDMFVSGASSQYLSSASRQDVRGHGDIHYTRTRPSKHVSGTTTFGYSQEFDVISLSGGYKWQKASKNQNRDFSVGGNIFYDTWKIIKPGELRYESTEFGNEEDNYNTDTRTTGTFSISYAQVLTKKLQILFSSDIVYQNGILYTPFHRVFFNDFTCVDCEEESKFHLIENLPRTRLKIPIGIRANYYINDWLISRLYYRYYSDDFGIKSHTVSIELPIKITRFFTVYPIYRFYTQTASKYFKPYGEHEMQLDTNYVPQAIEQYYTSDYDLSEFVNHKFGLGLKYSPLYGIAQIDISKERKIVFKKIEFRTVFYRRSDGLKAFTISFDTGFTF